jgi:hypothetical protein
MKDAGSTLAGDNEKEKLVSPEKIAFSKRFQFIFRKHQCAVKHLFCSAR